MIVSLSIKNFALIQDIAVQLHPGMTVITGETGAGKSILLGALGPGSGDLARRLAPDEGALIVPLRPQDLPALAAAGEALDAIVALQ